MKAKVGRPKKLDTIHMPEVSETKDRKALEQVKKIERKLSKKLVCHRLDSRTVIYTTRERMPELIRDHERNHKAYRV